MYKNWYQQVATKHEDTKAHDCPQKSHIEKLHRYRYEFLENDEIIRSSE